MSSNMTSSNDLTGVLSDIDSIDNTTQIQSTSIPIASSSLWSNQAYSASYYPCDNKEHVRKTIELEQADGTMTILSLDSNNIENLSEKFIDMKSFTWKWPFIKHNKKKLLAFDCKGKHYEVNCTLTAFAEALGIEYTSYAELMLKDALKHG